MEFNLSSKVSGERDSLKWIFLACGGGGGDGTEEELKDEKGGFRKQRDSGKCT